MPPTTHTVTINGLRARTGDHICAFYRGRDELDRLVVPYLQEGIHSGDVSICITGAAHHDRLQGAVLDGCGDAERVLLQFDRTENTYMQDGSFSAQRMLSYWGEWSHRTFEVEGRPFARTATDMSWAEDLFSTPVLDDFINYEVQATRYARSQPCVALCLYDLDQFRGNVIIPVLKVHPKVFFSGMLLENPYYVDPDELPLD